jgi:hypothetical protein
LKKISIVPFLQQFVFTKKKCKEKKEGKTKKQYYKRINIKNSDK